MRPTALSDDPGPLVRRLANASLTRVSTLSEELVDTLWDDVYRPDGPVTKDDLWRSCHDNIGSMLGMLSGTEIPAPELYGSAHATGNRRALQRCPLEWVLHAWRLGGRVIWTDIAQRSGGNADELKLLVNGTASVWDVIERFSSEMAATYHRAERELLAGTERPPMELVDALLDGREVPETLGFDPGGRYLVVVAELGESPAKCLRRNGIRSLWQSRGDHLVGVVALGRADPAAAVEALRTCPGRVGVSPVLTGFGEIRGGYRMATLAQATLPPGTRSVVPLDERLPAALLAHAPELTEHMVDATLGPILVLGEGERGELVDTLAAWLMSAGSAVRAARILYCHRNTVLNRLHRIAALTAVDPMDPKDWLRILLALTALRQTGRLTTPLLERLDGE